jgi:hypothetical protein
MQRQARRLAHATVATIIVLAMAPAWSLAHLGDSDHIHQPADQTTPTSSIWCVSFTDDPGTWRPEDANVVDGADMRGRMIFVDCSDVLRADFAVDTFSDGSYAREDYAGLIRATDGGDPGPATEPEAVDGLTAAAWTKHQRKWLQKGDKLAGQLRRANTLAQARKGLGAMQQHLQHESVWLRKNKDRFEPDSCLARDKANWEKRVAQARKSLNKMVTAANQGNLSAVSSHGRQFSRAYTKVEQIYNIGACDF